MGNCHSEIADVAVVQRCMASDIAELRELSNRSIDHKLPPILLSSSSASSAASSSSLSWVKMSDLRYRWEHQFYRIAPGCTRAAYCNVLFAILFAFKYPQLKNGTHVENKRRFLFCSELFINDKEQQNAAFVQVVKKIVDYSCSPRYSQEYNKDLISVRHKVKMARGGPEVSAGVESILMVCHVGNNKYGDSVFQLEIDEKTKLEHGDALALCVTCDDVPLEVLKILLNAVQKEIPQLLVSHRTKRLRTNISTTLPMLAASHACSKSSKMTQEHAISLMSLLLDYSDEFDFAATERIDDDAFCSPNILHYLCSMSANALRFLELLVSASRITEKMLVDKFRMESACHFQETKDIPGLGSGYCTFFQLAVKQASPYFVGECVTRKLFRQEDLEAAFFYACARSAKPHFVGIDPTGFGSREHLTDDEKAKFVTAVLSAFESRSEAIAKLKGKAVTIRSAKSGPNSLSTCLDLAYYFGNKALQDLLIANGFDVTYQKH